MKNVFLVNKVCVYRGVAMAAKMPSRALKKECAAILESMKVRVVLRGDSGALIGQSADVVGGRQNGIIIL